MRREGYELQVGKPQVIEKEIDGVKCEPYETLAMYLKNIQERLELLHKEGDVSNGA